MNALHAISAEAFLRRTAAACEPVLAGLLANPDVPPDLAAAMRHSVLGGGKRLRPALCLAAAEACGAPAPAAHLLPAACALELLHTYSLIHDDLPSMDDGHFRRGRPACHRVFGEATALLAGDALQALAFEALTRPVPGVPPVRQLAAVRVLAAAVGAAGMCGGQALDLAAAREAPDDAGLWRLQRMKTGALITAAVLIGGHLAGAPDPVLVALEAYGRAVGAAFQIADDILDVSGGAAALGKGVGTDAPAGKATAASRLGLEGARRAAGAAAEEAIAAAALLGPAAHPLEALARFAAERER